MDGNLIPKLSTWRRAFLSRVDAGMVIPADYSKTGFNRVAHFIARKLLNVTIGFDGD
jgi:hypothetical protein